MPPASLAPVRERNVTPHVAVDRRISKTGKLRCSAIDGRTTGHKGYQARRRQRIEEVFGWIKAAAGLRQIKHRGLPRVAMAFALATTAYNLIRLPRLLTNAHA
jgi:hypothetical protein